MIDSTTSTVTQTTTTSYWSRTVEGTNGIGGTAPTIGAGSIAGGGPAPDADPMSLLKAAMSSLAEIMPEMTGDEVDVLLGSIIAKMKEVTDQGDRDSINTNMEAKKDAIHQKEASLKDAETKMENAADKMKHASVWDKIKLAFSYIGAILTMIAGAVMIATCVGAAAGACLIAAGAVMLVLAIDSTVETAQKDQGKGSLGMFGMLVKECYEGTHSGCTEEEAEAAAEKGQMGIQIGLMGVALLLSLPAMAGSAASLVSGGMKLAARVAESVTEFAGMGETVASSVAEASASVTEAVETFQAFIRGGSDAADAAAQTARFQRMASILTKINDAGTAGSQVVDGTATAASAVYHYEATQDSSDAKKLQAEGKRFEGLGALLDDLMDAAMLRLKGSGERYNGMLEALIENVKDRGETLNRIGARV